MSNDQWSSRSLGQAMPGVLRGARENVRMLKQQSNRVLTSLRQARSQLDQRKCELEEIAGILDGMGNIKYEGGLYVLRLKHGNDGGWAERILQASGAPPRRAGDYCAVLSTLFLTIDSGFGRNITEALDKLGNTIPRRIPISYGSLPKPDIDVNVPRPNSNRNVRTDWKRQIYSLDPASARGGVSAVNAIANEVGNLSGTVKILEDEYSRIESELHDADRTLKMIDSVGAHAITCVPQENRDHDWWQRLVSAENAPPSSADMYSSGLFVVLLAQDPLVLARDYRKTARLFGV